MCNEIARKSFSEAIGRVAAYTVGALVVVSVILVGVGWILSSAL